MGFFDIFKKKKEEKNLSEVKSWLEGIFEKRKEKEKSVHKSIIEHKDAFLDTLEEGIKEIEHADLSQHKIEDRVKIIVKGNIKKYIFYLQQLIKSLEDDKNSAKELVESIYSNIAKFEQQSYKSFHKSTYLVGKEFETVQNAFKTFHKQIKEIQEDNTELLDSSYDEIAKLIEEIEKPVQSPDELVKKRNLTKKKIKKLQEEFSSVKKSESYKKREKLIQERETLKKEKAKKISELKSEIDMRALLKTFHGEKSYEDIKKYKENFNLIIENPDPIILFMKTAHLDTYKAEKIIQEIQTIKIPIIPEDPTVVIIEKITAAENELKEIDSQINKFNKNTEEAKEEIEAKMKNLQKMLEEKNIQLNF